VLVTNYLILDADYTSPLPPAFNQHMYLVLFSLFRYIITEQCHYCTDVKSRSS